MPENMTEHVDSSNATSSSSASELAPLLTTGTEIRQPAIMGKLREYVSQISIPVYIMVMFFAISSWIDINGLWVEVPLLVQELPEGWDLPSYLVIIIQVANIGPISYTLANRIWPNKVKEWPVIYVIIFIGAASCILLSFFWNATSYVAGELHSMALFALTGFLSIVDCTSSVVYLPYMAGFKAQYMTAFYIGEGLSGLIPGIVGLAQGLDRPAVCLNGTYVIYNDTTGENMTVHYTYPSYDPPHFSVEEFFYFLFAMLLISALSFSLLHWLSYSRKERIDSLSNGLIQNYNTEATVIENPACSGLSFKQYGSNEESGPAISDPNSDISETRAIESDRDNDGRDLSKRQLTNFEFAVLLILCAWVNGLTNGVIPSTQSYTCLPYGQRAYTLAVRLSTVANPFACFIALFLSTDSILVISVLSALGTVLAAIQVWLASLSPAPPLQGEVGGEVLVISTTILITGFFSYVKVAMATTVMAARGRRGLLWVGGVTQVGSLVCAVLTFVCVSVLQVFISMDLC